MKTKLETYNANRLEYINVAWVSKNNVSTKITNLDDQYLLNVMRSVSKSLVLAEHFPEVVEFQSYEGVTYKDWQKYLTNEYLYRSEVMKKQYNDYIDQQIYEQSARDRAYYDDMYDYGALGDIY